MGRPTVTDIACEAGVSLATVDRVLNARPGVRDKTIAAVNDAIARLGYVREMAAANLARGRNTRVAILSADTESQFVQTLGSAVKEAAALATSARLQVEVLRFPAEDMHRLAAMLAKLAASEVSGVALIAPETPILRDALRGLTAAGVPVVAMVSDLPNSSADRAVPWRAPAAHSGHWPIHAAARQYRATTAL